jgi:DNA-binding IclR family transcriptional regulator
VDIQVVQRVAEILDRFDEETRELRIGPMARELGVQRSTLHRYLNSMASAGLLHRNAWWEFTLGPILARIGPLALGVTLDFGSMSEVMDQLASDTGLTAVRSVWNDVAPVVVQVHTPPTPTHVTVRVGTRLPVTSAQTQVFLAYQHDSNIIERVLSLLPQQDRAELERAVEQTRHEGLAIGGRVEQGVRAIAAPIFDRTGAVVMTLALVGTEAAVSPKNDSRQASELSRMAATLSRQLCHHEEAHADEADRPAV